MPLSSKFFSSVYWWKKCERWSIFSEDMEKVH